MNAITWIPPGGPELELVTEEEFLVLPGMLGHRAPPVRMHDEEIPHADGGSFREVTAGVREVSIPLLVWATAEFQDDKMAALSAALDPSRGEGQLRVERDDGTFRLLNCRYVGGLEGTEEDPGHETAVLVFRAHDPYWHDLADVDVQVTQDLDVGTFFPFFPLQLLSSELFADVEVTNDGDVDAWPVWTVTGPGGDPVIRDLTNDRLVRVDAELASTDELVIDTRPGRKSVMLNGLSAFTSLGADSRLFPLAPGISTIRVELSGATEATIVDLAYRQRYRGV